MKKNKIIIILVSIIFAVTIAFKMGQDIKAVNIWEGKFDQEISSNQEILYSNIKDNLLANLKILENLNYISVQDEMSLMKFKSKIEAREVYLITHNKYIDFKVDMVMKKIYLKNGLKFKSTYIPVDIKNVKYIEGSHPNPEVPSVSRSLGERNYTMTYNLKQLSKLYSKLNSVNSHSGEAKMLNAYLYSIGKGFEGDEDTASCVTDESESFLYDSLVEFRSKVKECVDILENNSEYDLVEFKIKTDKYSVFIGNMKCMDCEVPMYFEFKKIHGGHGWTHI